MTSPRSTTSPAVIAGMILSTILTLLVCVAILRSAPRPEIAEALQREPDGQADPLGVAAEIVAGGVSVGRTLPAMAVRLEPGQTLDERLPPGPFEGVFTVTFSSGRVRYARLGAWIEGGSLILRRRDEILLSEFADERTLVLTREPVFLSSRAQQIVFEFRGAADRASALRAVWQPEGSSVPLPLPAQGARLDDDPALAGLVLAQRLGCARCHRTEDPVLQARLETSEAPPLDDVAARVRPGWLREWIADPHAVKPTTRMPALMHGRPADPGEVEDLVHYLASLARAPLDTDELPPPREAVDTGHRLYHEVGCVACHGPLESPPRMLRTYHALGRPALKGTVASLGDYLRDPIAVHPAGLMPSMLLDEDEARRIAAYLVDHDRRAHGTSAEERLAPDPARVARGRERFVERHCASCHEVRGAALEPAAAAPSLERLAAASLGNGCTGSVARAGLPHYRLDDDQRRDLRALLDRLGERRSDDVPHDALAATILRLGCVRCHAFQAERGPERAVMPYFVTRGEADLGDEGRLPPELSDAGARLHPQWIGKALAAGARARPYLATRMPVFAGRDVVALPEALCSVAGMPPTPEPGPEFDLTYAAAGRTLVGAGAMNCIQCHDIAGRRGTGTPGPDLVQMVERLRDEGFARWLHDPSLIRPGTRMPSFFTSGRSGFTDVFDGEAPQQIRAIWCYLSQGEMLPLPEGLIDPAGLVLEVTDEPVVFRTFMAAAGVRAIACGFPEQVHCAFDADRCDVVAAWTGSFLDASGAWAARGGSETNPGSLSWQRGDRPLLDAPSPGSSIERRFHGYALDEQRRPVFRYALVVDGQTIEIVDRPRPKLNATTAALVRTLALSGPAGATLAVHPDACRLKRGRGAWSDRGGDAVLTLDERGEASFEVEVTWE